MSTVITIEVQGFILRDRLLIFRLKFTIDTGASRTILSKSVFERMKNKPVLVETARILNACGKEIEVLD